MQKSSLSKRNEGLTLIEVTIAIFIFLIVAAGITATVLQSNRIAQANVIRNTAYTVVQGYLEQIRSISYATLKKSLDNPGVTPLPTMGISAVINSENPADIQVDDPLYLNVLNDKEVLLDMKNNPEGTPTLYTLKLGITPKITNLNDASYGAEAIPALEVILDFQYEARHKRGVEFDSGSLRTIIANI